MSRPTHARNGRQSPCRIPRIPRLPTPALQTRLGANRFEHYRHRRSPAEPRHRPAGHRPPATDLHSRPSLANCPAHRRCCRANPGGCPATRRRCPAHRWAAAASPVRVARPTARIPGWSMTASPTIRTARTNRPTAGPSHSSKGRHWHQAAPATGCSSRAHRHPESAATGKATRCRPGSGSGRDCHPRGKKATRMATTSPAAAASRATTSSSTSCSRRAPGRRPPATHGAG